ncbi:uncharacterized protein (DUF58 family) [Pullulanibacillus pueri]|uniref:DUF58 domain-containing protein n=1 Tax=Pullulanibacillus pueri TaxID=1437324 RepID=A0A8J2ZT41_9BACL|nr:DUF58 domain-containing protein [Pullulanibacillus pueri]MBM7681041.1 uncharacterized protein (DUF58 family) [Pullulanibacillus pueri]GGH76813.1 hypothetical protein GCM10007096_07780 [Pullulanibacillus pueri]
MGMAWLIIIALVLIIIQSILFTKWGLSRIGYTRFFSDDAVFEGEEVEMIEQISNKKLLPVPWLRLESHISADLQFQHQHELEIADQQFHRSLFSLMPFQKITRRHKVTCKKRGHYRLNTVEMTNGDLLGLNGTHGKLQVSAELIVYPKLLSIEEIFLPSHSLQGDYSVKRWIIEDPFMKVGIRDYLYGDAMNSINWKATARAGTLQVNQKDFTADHHLMIYLNFELTDDIWMPIMDRPLIERGISYAATIAQYALDQGIPTGFSCNSYIKNFDQPNEKEPIRILPKNSQHQLTLLLETLAKLQMDRRVSFQSFLQEEAEQQMPNTDILLITGYLSEKARERIQQLEAQGHAVEIFWLSTNSEKESESMEEEKQYV